MNKRKKGLKLSEDIIEEKIKTEKITKRRNKLIMVLAVVSIAGFLVSFLFLIGITGAAVGETKGNLYGLIFIIISLLTWIIAELLWVREKKKKEIDIKKLLQELEKEGVPLTLLYNKYLK